jgi:hypothetical protein
MLDSLQSSWTHDLNDRLGKTCVLVLRDVPKREGRKEVYTRLGPLMNAEDVPKGKAAGSRLHRALAWNSAGKAKPGPVSDRALDSALHRDHDITAILVTLTFTLLSWKYASQSSALNPSKPLRVMSIKASWISPVTQHKCQTMLSWSSIAMI